MVLFAPTALRWISFTKSAKFITKVFKLCSSSRTSTSRNSIKPPREPPLKKASSFVSAQITFVYPVPSFIASTEKFRAILPCTRTFPSRCTINSSGSRSSVVIFIMLDNLSTKRSRRSSKSFGLSPIARLRTISLFNAAISRV